MKPSKLKFAGIGSYPGHVEINFDDLSPKGLYLIVGPTGSGKTTILDAMSFAMFGSMPSDRQNAIVNLHPDRVPNPFIEFEFIHGGRRYVTHREPALPGKQINSSKQWIREFDQHGHEISTTTNAVNVTKRCEDILGLKVDEFTQVILLPQGKFQGFLMAKGKEKQSVLQTIFGTWTYDRIVEAIKRSAQQLGDEVALDEVAIGNQWAIIDSNFTALHAIKSLGDLPDPRQDLQGAVATIRNASEVLDAEQASTLETQLTVKAEQTRMKKEAERFDKSVKLEDLRKTQTAESKMVTKYRKQLDDHARAEPVANAIETRDLLVEELKTVESSVSTLRADIQRTAQKLAVRATVTKTFADSIPTASPSALSSEFAKLQSALENAASKAGDLAGLHSDATRAKAAEESTTKEVARLEKALTTASNTAMKLNSSLKQKRSKVKGLAAAERAVASLEELLVRADVASAKSALVVASGKLKKAQATFDRAELGLRSAQEQISAHLAGELASELSPGKKCPVCGSKNHPQLAKKSSKLANLEKLESIRDTANKVRLNAERDVKESQKALNSAQSAAKKLPTLADQMKIRKTLKVLTALSEEIDVLEVSADEALDLKSSLSDDLADARTILTTLVSERKTRDRSIKRLETEVSQFGSVKEISASTKTCAELKKLLKVLDGEVKSLENLQGKVNQSRTNVMTTLKKSGFDTEKAALTAVLIDDDVDLFHEAVTTFDKRDRDILALDAVVGNEPVPKMRPDTDQVNRRLAEAATIAESASQVAGSVRAALNQITGAKILIDRIGPKIEEKSRRASQAQSIATVFEKGAGGPEGQLSLVMWVQRTLFEEVCLVANSQLRSLSNNRYSLTLEQLEGGIRKTYGSGLDIYVLDSHTGRTRPVQTMSGGEQFMASLALALALAEVVQRHAGGIELPCLFIDEGFGGLDGESLDLAINVLGKLQAAGRTVGIITHVAEMHERLPIGIRVSKSDRGSTLEVLPS